MDVGVGVLFFAVVAVVALLIWLRARDRKERLKRLTQDAQEFLDRASGGGLRPVQTRLILKNDEHAILEEGSALFETRAYRVYGGAGTRSGRVYIGGGSSEPRQRLRQIDEGTTP